MEERVLAKSKPASPATALLRRFGIPVVLFLLLLVYYSAAGKDTIAQHLGADYNGSIGRFFTAALLFEFDAAGAWFVPPVFWAGILTLIWGVVRCLKYRGMSLTVTDRRIYGVSTYGRRIDLPLASVQSVSASGNGSLRLLTTSGEVLFGGFENGEALFHTISGLLNQRQA